MKLTLRLDRSTKGTHVYTDGAPDAPVPTLYIKKGALPSPAPEVIEIIITVPEVKS